MLLVSLNVQNAETVSSQCSIIILFSPAFNPKLSSSVIIYMFVEIFPYQYLEKTVIALLSSLFEIHKLTGYPILNSIQIN